jgi:hypothetical protein
MQRGESQKFNILAILGGCNGVSMGWVGGRDGDLTERQSKGPQC